MASSAALPRIRQESLAERAYSELKEAILAGRLAPGSPLAEVELADALGISRTPVREALALLRRDGLIQPQPGGTNVVRVLDEAEVRELFLIREALECLTVRECIRAGGDAEVLRPLLERQRAAHRADDVQAFLAADEDFHLAICHQAGLPHVAELLSSLRDKMRQAGLGAVTQADRMKAVLREHEMIVRSIRRGDGDAAETSIRRHLDATRSAFAASRS